MQSKAMYQLKDLAKASATRAGLGYDYHDAWWRLKVRGFDPVGQWSRKHEAIFIHIPKTAGMSLYGCLGIDEPREKHVPLAGYRAFDRDFCDRAYKFAVVRNPWDRLVSAFHYVKNNSKANDDREWVGRTLARYATFEDFLVAIENPMFRAHVATWRYFLPQWYFICDRRGRPRVNEVIRFEDLEAGTRAVAERIGVPFTATWTNASTRRPYRSYYSEETQALVARMYHKDAAIFGYKF